MFVQCVGNSKLFKIVTSFYGVGETLVGYGSVSVCGCIGQYFEVSMMVFSVC